MQGQVKKGLCDEDGGQLIEFTLCLPILLTVFVGVVYFSFVLYVAHFVTNGANEGARYAIVRGSEWKGVACTTTSTVNCTATNTDVSNYVASALPGGLGAANLTVSTTWSGKTATGGTCDTQNGSNSPNCLVKVQATYVLSFPLPYMSSHGTTLSSTAVMTVVQ
jgi:Flp pilus assembly protein TadG